MSVNDEAAKWGQEVQVGTQKFQQETRKVLADAAARGHLLPPGAVQGFVLEMGQEVKRGLTKGNARVYQEEMARQDKAAETALKIILGLSKLDMEAYRSRLENQADLDRAEAEADLDKRRAELQILKANIDKRQAAIIEERARIEAEIVYWKRKQVEAEGLSLDAEVALIYEKVRTAETKLLIIPELHKVIAAEQLVVAAEERRASALQLVIAAEKELAAIKEEMIPLYLQKADARKQQAAAITQEAEWRKKTEELGYRRLDLKEEEEAKDHQVRLANLTFENTQLESVRADRMLQLAREQARTVLAQYELAIRNQWIELKKELEKDERGYRQELRWFWTQLQLLQEITGLELEKQLYLNELAVRLANLQAEGRDDCLTERASGRRKTQHRRGTTEFRYISKG